MIKRTTETLRMSPSKKCIIRSMCIELDKPIDIVALNYALVTTCPDAALSDPMRRSFIGNKNADSINAGSVLGELYQQDEMPKNFEEFKKRPYADGILMIGKIRCYSYGNPRFNNILLLAGKVQPGEAAAMKGIVNSIQNAKAVYDEVYTEPDQQPYEVVSVLGYAFDRYEDLHIHYSASLPLCLVYRFLEDLLKRDEIADYNLSAVIDTGKELETVNTTAREFESKLCGVVIESGMIIAQNSHVRIFFSGADCNNVRIFVKGAEDDFFATL